MPNNKKRGNSETKKPPNRKKEIVILEPQKLIKSLPKDTPKDVREAISVIMSQYQFTGPLPPPKILAGYADINQTFPERIMKMAEKEQKHRQRQQKKHLAEELKIVKYGAETERIDITRGQIFGFFIGITAIVAGTITALLGQPIVGGLIGFGGVAGLVSVFIIGRSGKNSKKMKETKENEK